MKRFHFLLFGFALCVAGAVGYDSHEIKKDSFQVNDHTSFEAIQVDADYSAELPVVLALDVPDLGSPASNHSVVSENLTHVFLIRIRPPPEKVQKSYYTEFKT
jgi:hypothetical protein